MIYVNAIIPIQHIATQWHVQWYMLLVWTDVFFRMQRKPCILHNYVYRNSISVRYSQNLRMHNYMTIIIISINNLNSKKGKNILKDCYHSDASSNALTHWARVTHKCVSSLTIIGSDNGLSPGRCQAIIWNNAGILPIRTQGTNVGEILIEIYVFSFTKIHLKTWSAKWQPFCISPSVLNV